MLIEDVAAERVAGPDEAAAEREWTSELGRRRQDVQDGSVELMSLDEVKRQMAERRAGRSVPATD